VTVALPRITPMPLARLDAPFEHPDWIFEPKLDGFRAVAYVEAGACRLVSRNWNAFKTFDPLARNSCGSCSRDTRSRFCSWITSQLYRTVPTHVRP
jgi:hypothetical protein